jgi:hypothetical protein
MEIIDVKKSKPRQLHYELPNRMDIVFLGIVCVAVVIAIA